jgi:large subunit ribosomal protein L17
MGFRVGDNAPMALVELVDRPDLSENVSPSTVKAQE